MKDAPNPTLRADDMILPDRSRALVGFRAWRLRRISSNPSKVVIGPLGFHTKDNPWLTDDLVGEARCAFSRRSAKENRSRCFGGTPSEDCHCGLYGYATLEKLQLEMSSCSHAPPYILGIVAIEGRILRWTHGFKAQRAMILAFFNPSVDGPWISSHFMREMYCSYFGVRGGLGLLGAEHLWEMHAHHISQYNYIPGFHDIPILHHREPFRDLEFLRGWADARNCDLYVDTIDPDEPLKGTVQNLTGGR